MNKPRMSQEEKSLIRKDFGSIKKSVELNDVRAKITDATIQAITNGSYKNMGYTKKQVIQVIYNFLRGLYRKIKQKAVDPPKKNPHKPLMFQQQKLAATTGAGTTPGRQMFAGHHGAQGVMSTHEQVCGVISFSSRFLLLYK